MSKLIDLTGQRFGKIEVLSRSENIGRRQAWNCKCDCGKLRIVIGESLRSGKTKGCGCNRQHENLVGKKFFRLTVIEEVGRYRIGEYKYRCICDCGNVSVVTGIRLKNGHTKSCGCLKLESISKTFTTHGHCTGGKTTEYISWNNMVQRCKNPNVDRYESYGGRGITVCERWANSFENFLQDMGEKPSLCHSIDRIDVNGNYGPENCKWATKLEQARNKRTRKTNKIGVTGVWWDEKNKKFCARIGHEGRIIRLGSFETVEEATISRQEAELKYWKPS